MIKHIVLFKVRDDVSRDDPRVGGVFGILRALPDRINVIQQWEVGENFSDRPIAVDYSLFSSFPSREDLARYIDHPAHREVVGLLQEVCTWQVCDYVAG
jgi:hypothetical protein